MGLAIAVYRGLLPPELIDLALSPEHVLPVPAVPSSSLVLTEAHFDSCETQTRIQLQPRLGVVGYTTGFCGLAPVLALARHRALLLDAAVRSERAANITLGWLEHDLHRQLPEIKRQCV